jgi:predicted nucleic acid-binding protein
MPWLYLETNFLLSFAYGQNPDSERLLLHIEAKTIDVVVPEVCIVEAIASWRHGRSRMVDLTKDYGRHQRELGRWSSSEASDASDMFRDLPVKLELAQKTARDRLLDCFRRLEKTGARFVSGQRGWLDPLTRIVRANGDVDDYICSAIISDGRGRSAAYFLTENKDFHQPSVVADMTAAGVTVLMSPSDAIVKYP